MSFFPTPFVSMNTAPSALKSTYNPTGTDPLARDLSLNGGTAIPSCLRLPLSSPTAGHEPPAISSSTQHLTSNLESLFCCIIPPRTGAPASVSAAGRVRFCIRGGFSD
jgi:hypothetical protein